MLYHYPPATLFDYFHATCKNPQAPRVMYSQHNFVHLDKRGFFWLRQRSNEKRSTFNYKSNKTITIISQKPTYLFEIAFRPKFLAASRSDDDFHDNMFYRAGLLRL